MTVTNERGRELSAADLRWISKMNIKDMNNRKLRALGREFGKTDRIVAGDDKIFVKVHTEPPMGMAQYPGWSHYPGIHINGDFFSDLADKRALVQLLGLNYHELSHLLWTPRGFKGNLDQKLRSAFNILEDQRIESLFTARYLPAGKYFTEMVVKMFVERQDSWGTAFLFTHGRSYLPLEIREEFESRFEGSSKDRNKAKRIIDEFKTIRSDQMVGVHRERVEELCRDFARILMRNQAPQPDCTGTDQSEGQTDTTSEKEAGREDQRRREEEEETGEDQSGFWEEEDEDDEDAEGEGTAADESDDEDSDDGDGESDSGEDESESDGSSDDEGDSDGEGSESEDGDSGDSDDDEGESASGSGEGDGDDEGDLSDEEGVKTSGEGGAFDLDKDWAEYLEDVLDAVREDEEVNNEIDHIKATMNDRNKIDVIDFLEDPEWMPVDDDMKSACNTVTQEFRRVYADVEPGWRYGSDTGRLNVGRAMENPDDLDELFDEWEEGREHESGIECFMAGDTSGSMTGVERDMVYKAHWIIKRALDDVGAKLTFVAFDSETTGLMSREETVRTGEYPYWHTSGGSTQPAESMHMGRRLLEASPMPNKLFIILTDGGWGGRDAESHDGIADFENLIRSIDGTTLYLGIGDGGITANKSYQRFFDQAISMTNYDHLVDVVKATITHMIETVAGRR